jgi:prepilin-type N-terminal cleavage/methylation domain-containing protein
MKNVYKQKRSEGFTIIEVLIVLAIAALILLIVFLAVPALQRNSRNNGVKNDAANLLAAVNDFASNNGGGLPTSESGTGAITFTNGVAGVVTSEAKVQGATTVSFSSKPASAPSVPAVGTVMIVTGWKCNGNAAYTASSRSVMAIFQIENGTSTNSPQCIDS